MSLERIRIDWTKLGAADPLWAVLVHPERRNRRWDPEAFFLTGAEEVTAAMEHARSFGLVHGSGRALDFGCGVGRLSAALAGFFDEVVGVDISPTMLAKARELDRTGRCTFVENNRDDLSLFQSDSFDLAYSSLVLQHMPAPIALRYLAEILRVLKPGGVAIIQTARRPDRSARGWIARVAPRRALRFAQRRLLGYPAPMDMHGVRPADVEALASRCHASIVDVVDDPMYGGHWSYSRFYLAAG